MNAEAISHEDYMNAPGESFSITFDTAGTYGFYCEPHQGAGMAGKLTGASAASPSCYVLRAPRCTSCMCAAPDR